jgi:hypothetical protein
MKGIHQLVCQWDACLNAHINFFIELFFSAITNSEWVSFEQASYYYTFKGKAVPVTGCEGL